MHAKKGGGYFSSLICCIVILPLLLQTTKHGSDSPAYLFVLTIIASPDLIYMEQIRTIVHQQLRAINVEEAGATTSESTPQPASAADLYFLPVSIGIIVAIVVIGLVIILMLRKR